MCKYYDLKSKEQNIQDRSNLKGDYIDNYIKMLFKQIKHWNMINKDSNKSKLYTIAKVWESTMKMTKRFPSKFYLYS